MELGVAGSAIGIASFVIQLGDGILKLKEFWDSVKDAPEEILRTLDELDTMRIVLAEIEENLGDHTASPAAIKSLQLCKKGMDVLNKVVKEMEREIQNRKKWGGLKVVLKKDFLEKMEKRLGGANRLMLMSHQNYIASLDKSRYDEQVKLAKLQYSEFVDMRNTLHTFISIGNASAAQQQISNRHTASFSNTPITKDATSISKTTRTLSKHQKIINAKLRLPFFSGVWEFLSYRQSTFEWGFKFRTYNVVKYDAPIMRLARMGDVAGMQRLFQSGQASLSDVTNFGETLLHFATTYNYYNACRFLIEQGADPNAKDIWGHSVTKQTFIWNPDRQDLSPLIHYLTPMMDFDIINELLLDGSGMVCGLGSSDLELFEWLIHSTEIPVHLRSDRERALLVLGISARMISSNMPHFVWTILGGRNMETCVQNMSNEEFWKLLSNIADALGDSLNRNIIEGHMDVKASLKVIPDAEPASQEALQEILSLARDTLSAGLKHHCMFVDYTSTTPLRQLLGQHIYNLGHRSKTLVEIDLRKSQFANPIGIWLDQLTSAGFDIVEYGRWEKTMHRTNQNNWIRCLYEKIDTCYSCYYFRWISFTYGPEKSDWQFWFTFEPKWMYFGELAEFWDMVDHPERQMPGAWNF
ncbi:hypothetical protein NHQ30_001081 [Ciborinia camelliae]|nr:hypothetical protein NHQ30_001081 [Ciborinia camelliae]